MIRAEPGRGKGLGECFQIHLDVVRRCRETADAGVRTVDPGADLGPQAQGVSMGEGQHRFMEQGSASQQGIIARAQRPKGPCIDAVERLTKRARAQGRGRAGPASMIKSLPLGECPMSLCRTWPCSLVQGGLTGSMASEKGGSTKGRVGRPAGWLAMEMRDDDGERGESLRNHGIDGTCRRCV